MRSDQAALSATTRLVLLRMAVTAHDGDEEPRYHAGWIPLALFLGYPLGSAKERDTAKRAVKRALRELVEAGLVKPLHEWEKGRRVYLLLLDHHRIKPTG
ncbi:hypothetical protein [Nocardioides sp. KR10-350]|uniref:hypothetical protein n=1 Tax=Nocardioides cheoyonin TaxID=3156615 RepID=UPI0032B3251A